MSTAGPIAKTVPATTAPDWVRFRLFSGVLRAACGRFRDSASQEWDEASGLRARDWKTPAHLERLRFKARGTCLGFLDQARVQPARSRRRMKRELPKAREVGATSVVVSEARFAALFNGLRAVLEKGQ